MASRKMVLSKFSVFVKYLQSLKTRVEAPISVTFRRSRLLISAASPALLRPNPSTLYATRFWPRNGCVTPVRPLHSITSCSKPERETVLSPAPADQQTSLVAVPIYDKSPASFGINGWSGYEPFVAPGTPLPCTRSVTLRSNLDYIGRDTIEVCGFLPKMRLRVILAKLTMVGMQKATKEKTTIKASMELRTDLSGSFTTRFTPENGAAEGKASVDFRGGQVLSQGDGNALDTGSFLVVEE